MGFVFIEWIFKDKVFLVRDSITEMPGDMVSLVVSTGLGVSIVAGILSGVCYVLAYGSPKKSNRKSKNNLHCDVCGEYFRSIDHILGGDSKVSCVKCEKKVCQKRCANLDKQQSGWMCKNCMRPPESWFQGVLYAFQSNKKDEPKIKMDSIQDPYSDEIKKSKEEVQEFIEKLVTSMLGQNVDDANVSKLYNDKQYLPLTGQPSPCTAHAALKQLIEKLLREVLGLPQLQLHQQGAAIPPDLDNKTYEDLLATAIINKAISNSQNAHHSSSAASVSSRISHSPPVKDEKGFFFGEETLEGKWRSPDFDTTSVSSLEDWLQNDSSFGSKKYIDKVTLTIKQNIEEVSHGSESDNDSDGDGDGDDEYFRNNTSFWNEDEDNWFLQKKTFQGAHSPVPVPMLVPNPTTEAKVLIGDKEIDETSDLSDVESELEDVEIVPTCQSVLIESKTVIGGKHPLRNGVTGGESGSESSADSGVKEVDRGQSVYDESEFTDKLDEANESGFREGSNSVNLADISIDDENVEDVSIYSNTEQEAEYTERYASLPRTIEKKPDPPPRPSITKSRSKVTDLNTEPIEKQHREEDKLVQLHFSGSYSRREKEKWKNAIEMKNNPYSKENIEKRIRRSNSGAGSLFGPDYYAKLASSPSGTKLKSTESTEQTEPPQTLQNEVTVVDVSDINEEYTKESIPEKHISRTYISKEDNQNTFKAIPVIIEPEQSAFEIIQTNHTPPKSPLNEPEMTSLTSDSDLSCVHIYNIENAEVSKKPKESASTEQTTETAKPTFIKSSKTSNRNFVITPPLRKHKSETDLLEEFYPHPKVLGKKRDNTLISRIYLDPQVRSFALSTRPHLPVNNVVPTFRTQISNPETVIKAYYSDDGLSTVNKPFTSYSSEEDLLDSNLIEVKNGTMIHTAKMSLSSEDDQYSERSSSTDHRGVRQIYSSNEDLLSIDENDLPRKKDNTLISKIYQQPNVREYALSTRSTIPIQEKFPKNEKISDLNDDVFDTPVASNTSSKKNIFEVETQMVRTVENEFEENGNYDDNDPGVEAIAKRKIVHNFLNKYSTSQPILSHVESKEDVNSDGEITISVKDLRKKFENNESKSIVVSSLTARSLSKQMKQDLRD